MRRGLFLALGAASQAAQFLFLRELLCAAQGSELSAAAVLAVWMAAHALGSAMGARMARRWDGAVRRRMYALLAVDVAGLLPLLLWLSRGLRGWFGVPAGALLPAGQILAGGLAVAGPVALSFGVLFSLAVSIRREEEREAQGAARVYLGEALGAAAAGFLCSAVLVVFVNPFTLAILAAGGHAVVALGALWNAGWRAEDGSAPVDEARGAGPAVRPGFVALAGAGFVAAVAFLAGPMLDRSGHRMFWRQFGGGRLQLAATAESPYGPLAALTYGGQTSVYESGSLLASLPDRGESAPLVHLAMLQVARPRRVLLVHGTWSGALKTLLTYPVERVDAVEQDSGAGALAGPYLGAADRKALADRRVNQIVADGRRFIRGAVGEYDVILVFPPDPATLSGNRFFTKEFFQEITRILADGGVFALGPVAGHTSCAEESLVERNGMLWRTLQAAFPSVRVTAGPACLFLSSTDPTLPCLDPDVLGERLRTHGVSGVDLFSLVEPQAIRKVEYELKTGLPFDPLAEPGAEIPGVDGPVNTDSRPVMAMRSMVAGAGSTGDAAGVVVGRLGPWPWWTWILLFLLGFGVMETVLWRAGTSVAMAWQVRHGVGLAALGFWGAGVEWLVLASFQSSFGVLYQWAGALISAFMLGLAGGCRWGAHPRRMPPSLAAVLRTAAVWSLAAGGLFPLAAALRACAGPLVPDILLALAHLGAAFGAGAIVGAGYPLALRAVAGPEDDAGGEPVAPSGIAGAYYALDVVGGVAGTLLAACVLLPGHGAWPLVATGAAACLLASIGTRE